MESGGTVRNQQINEEDDEDTCNWWLWLYRHELH